MPNPTAAMLTIGDEILSGRTRDTNMPHLAQALGAKGIALRETRVVPDDMAEIVAAVNALRSPLRPRLHLRRHRADPRRHHRRCGRRRLRRDARRARGCPRDPRRQLCQPGAGPEPGAPPDGAHPGRRRADREPDLPGARLLARERARDGRGARGLRGDGRGTAAAADRRAAAPVGDAARRPARGRGRRAARPDRRGATRASPSAAIPSLRDGRFGTNLVARSDDPEALAAAFADLRGLARELAPG